MRQPVIGLLAVLALVATACGDGDDDDAATTTSDPGAAWTTCESTESGYRIDHPPDWVSNDGGVMPPCSLFDPQPFEVPEQTEIPTEIAVAVTVEPGAPASGDPLGERVLTRRDETVDGHDATRVEVEATGEGLYPEGMRTTRWTITASDGRIVARTHDVGDLPYTEKQDALDGMVETLDIDGGGTTTTTTSAEQPVGDPSTDDVQSPEFPAGFTGETAYLTDVRLAAHDDFDRAVFELEGDDLPSYRVREIDPPIREDGSGRQVEVAGDAYLEVSLQPASGVDLRGEEARHVYRGPDRVSPAGGHVVREAVRTGDFESHLTWVIGLSAETPFAVTTLRDPLRLIIDIVPDEGGSS